MQAFFVPETYCSGYKFKRPHLSAVMCAEFFKAQVVFHDALCRFLAVVAIVPRLVPAGKLRLIRRIALYKPVLGAICIEPLVKLGVHLGVIVNTVLLVEYIDRKPCLMLAAARIRHDLPCKLDRLVI